ncbi:MAG TPA: peroxidase family protein [Thermomicrobiales bacterium]|jgi:L-ascorbate peroxidase
MTALSDRSAATTEAALRDDLMGCMPIEQAPAFLRLAFHDAGTYDVQTHKGGADGAIHLAAELARSENAGWGSGCIGVLTGVKERFPDVSWADLVAIGGAAAVAKCGGPVIEVGIGRIDAADPAPEHRLPTSDEGAARLKAHFVGMGLGPRELVALSGGHTLGKANGRPFTRDYLDFSNDYFVQLLGQDDDPATGLLPSDRALLDDPESRPYVELYARDEAAFLRDFADAYRRLTWLGGEPPDVMG